jgi:hypothetical protein
MKNALLAGLTAALLLSFAITASADDRVVSVTFASVAALETKSGEKLDPGLFHFGKASGAEQDRSRVSSNGFHRSKKDACRWALLGGFIKFQHKAKEAGLKVVGVRTFAGDAESSRSDQCLCLAGGIVVRSVIQASYK